MLGLNTSGGSAFDATEVNHVFCGGEMFSLLLGEAYMPASMGKTFGGRMRGALGTRKWTEDGSAA
jgi:hypothetical protein